MKAGVHKTCAVCGQTWNVSIRQSARPYICPSCERKKAREAYRAKLRKVGVIS